MAKSGKANSRKKSRSSLRSPSVWETATPPPLIPYPVRESARAKHVNIKVSQKGEVEIVVPIGFNQQRLPDIIRQRQPWITKTLQKVEANRRSLSDEIAAALPDKIMLNAVGEEWAIAYEALDAPWVRYRIQDKGQLVIEGDIQQTSVCQDALRLWIQHYAAVYLPPWLQQVSQEINLPCSKITIRRQKTIWASCSGKRNISLNCKLLLLPPHLVRYVFIHELCHTIHMNHSDAFWAVVNTKDPDYRQNDAALNKAWQYVPQWF